MSDSTESRKEFENFAHTQMLDGTSRGQDGQYNNFDVRFAWNLWQAATSAALEKAAQIADGWAESKSCTNEPVCEHMRTGNGIAIAIRALKAEEKHKRD